MRIVCLVNGGDSLVAYHHTKKMYPDDDVVPLHFNLNLPHSKKLLNYMPGYVLRDSFHKYADVMGVVVSDDSVLCDNPYEPIIWSAVVKHSADKVILGLIDGDFESLESATDWIRSFNSKFASKEMIECPLLTLDKEKVIKLANVYGCMTDVLASIPCRSKEPLAYGCGNCYDCVRKRSAILNAGRISNIPPITKMNGRIRLIINSRANDLLSGVTQESIECQFFQILPGLEEFFGTDDPFKMIKQIK